MNARLNKENVVCAGKRILGLAGLVSLVLVCAGPVSAQSQPTQTESPAVRPVATAAATSQGTHSPSNTPAAAPAVKQNSSAKRSAPKGPSEGIMVHGHWIIDVKNPDGKLVTHREFENSLAPTTGGQLLSALLGRQVGAYSWAVAIGGTGICSNPQSLIMSLSYPGTVTEALQETSLVGCTLGEASGIYFQSCTDANGCFPGGLNPPSFLNPPVATSGSFPTPTGVIPPTILVLSGQMTAEQSGTITGVLTQLMTTANPESGYGGTPAAFQGIPAQTQQITGTGLTPVPTPQQFIPFGLPFTGLTLGLPGSCGGSNQPPCQLPVNQKQVVSVTVQLSFQ